MSRTRSADTTTRPSTTGSRSLLTGSIDEGICFGDRRQATWSLKVG